MATAAMVETEQQPKSQRKKEEQESSGLGSLGILVALIYATGLVTTNLFLSRLALADFSLIKPRAIFTGLIVLSGLALLAAGPIHVVSMLKETGNKKVVRPFPASFILWSSVKLVVPLGLATLLCWAARSRTTGVPIGLIGIRYIVMPSPWIRFLDALAVAGQLYFSSIAAAWLAIEALRLFRSIAVATSFPGIAARQAKLTLYVAGTLLATGWYMQSFAAGFYAVVPQQLGGGSPEKRQLIIPDSSRETVAALGVKFDEKSRFLTQPLMVFYESDDFIAMVVDRVEAIPDPPKGVISQESAVVVRVDKKLIDGWVIPADQVDVTSTSYY